MKTRPGALPERVCASLIIAFRSVTESYNETDVDDLAESIIAFRSVTESYNLLG